MYNVTHSHLGMFSPFLTFQPVQGHVLFRRHCGSKTVVLTLKLPLISCRAAVFAGGQRRARRSVGHAGHDGHDLRGGDRRLEQRAQRHQEVHRLQPRVSAPALPRDSEQTRNQIRWVQT